MATNITHRLARGRVVLGFFVKTLNLVLELLGDHQRFRRPEGAQAPAEYRRRPNNEMDPIGRLIGCFDPKCEADNNGANDENDKYRRAIVGAMLAEFKAAMGALLDNFQIARIKPAGAAFGTTAQKTGAKHGDGDKWRFCHALAIPLVISDRVNRI